MKMVARSSSTHKIMLLTGTENYSSWSVQMAAVLRSERLWKAIEPPTGTVIAKDSDENLQAIKILILSIDPTIMVYIENAKLAKGEKEK